MTSDDEPTNAALAHNLRAWADHLERRATGLTVPAFREQGREVADDLRLAARRLEPVPDAEVAVRPTDAGPPGEGE